tara:strand:+ start:936 stop:2240 length:1305 start_codon:yes stop_codon:yes gene_type:complete
MKKLLLYLILIMAVGMAGTVAYVSVNGLLKVFAGAGTVGLILFSSIEAAKIVATSAIHTYGKKIGWFYNGILSLFIAIAMIITSMGIYGFLSSSYKQTFSKFENMEAQIELLEKKVSGYQGQLDIVNNEKKGVSETITQLTKGLSNNVIQYKDKETGEIITTTSSSTRKVLQKQLDGAIERQGVLNDKSDALNDKVFEVENEITDIKLADDVGAELGPLRYLADVTGMSMDDVMKYFIILLIVIGDPMAVVMVIVFSKVVNYGKVDSDKPTSAKNAIVDPNEGLTEDMKKVIVKEELKIKEEKVKEIVNQFESNEKEDDTEYFDEAHALDMVLNNMVEDLEEEDIIEEADVIEELSKPENKVYMKSNEGVEEITTNETDEKKGIAREDIKEIKESERGFSVSIPVRNKKNDVERIGSNKEVRNGKSDKVYFKRR